MLLKLKNEMVLQCYQSDNPPYTEGCDSVEGYCLFNTDGSYNDGGELDYNSEMITEEGILEAVIEMATGECMNYKIIANTSDCQYEDFDELLEEEFERPTELAALLKEFSNEDIREKIKEAFQNATF